MCNLVVVYSGNVCEQGVPVRCQYAGSVQCCVGVVEGGFVVLSVMEV